MVEKGTDWRTVKFNIPHEWYAQLKKMREDARCATMSELFRYIIRGFLKERSIREENTT